MLSDIETILRHNHSSPAFDSYPSPPCILALDAFVPAAPRSLHKRWGRHLSNAGLHSFASSDVTFPGQICASFRHRKSELSYVRAHSRAFRWRRCNRFKTGSWEPLLMFTNWWPGEDQDENRKQTRKHPRGKQTFLATCWDIRADASNCGAVATRNDSATLACWDVGFCNCYLICVDRKCCQRQIVIDLWRQIAHNWLKSLHLWWMELCLGGFWHSFRFWQTLCLLSYVSSPRRVLRGSSSV